VTDPAPPLADGLFRLDGDDLTLLGGRSATSGRSHFPRQPVCPYTGADDVEPVDLPRSGRLWGWTAVTAAPPGYTGEVPYGLGVVELDDGLRVVGRLTVADVDALHEGRPMRVVPDRVPDHTGEPRTTWAFAPTDAPGDDASGGAS
jgi:uncharacterized protein